MCAVYSASLDFLGKKAGFINRVVLCDISVTVLGLKFGDEKIRKLENKIISRLAEEMSKK